MGLLPDREIPPPLARDLIDVLAYMRMIPETTGLLSRCDDGDAVIEVGSDLELRLDFLAIDEALDQAISDDNVDLDCPYKNFETLLARFDKLVGRLDDLEGSQASLHSWKAKGRRMRASLVRQAALACIRAQKPADDDPDLPDWSTISLDLYTETVERLVPQITIDSSVVDKKELVELEYRKLHANALRRSLLNVYSDSRKTSVSSVRIGYLLENDDLGLFKRELRDFTRMLERAFLPEPRLLKESLSASFVDLEDADSDMSSNERGADVQECLMSPSRAVGEKNGDQRAQTPGSESKVADAPLYRRGKRKNRSQSPSDRDPGDTPENAKALAKANERLQRDIAGRPGTVQEALDICQDAEESVAASPKRTSIARDDDRPTSASERRASAPNARRKAFTTRTSPGEQVNFDDSQSVDEPSTTGPTLQDRPSPNTKASIRSPPRGDTNGTKQIRTPWSDEEVEHLRAAVHEIGPGKWSEALRRYEFHPCRTSVSLKDKWRNLTK